MSAASAGAGRVSVASGGAVSGGDRRTASVVDGGAPRPIIDDGDAGEVGREPRPPAVSGATSRAIGLTVEGDGGADGIDRDAGSFDVVADGGADVMRAGGEGRARGGGRVGGAGGNGRAAGDGGADGDGRADGDGGVDGDGRADGDGGVDGDGRADGDGAVGGGGREAGARCGPRPVAAGIAGRELPAAGADVGDDVDVTAGFAGGFAPPPRGGEPSPDAVTDGPRVVCSQ